MSSPVEEDKMPKLDEDFLQVLGKSYKIAGAISPVTLDPTGGVIDGFHRLAIDPLWPKLVITWVGQIGKEGDYSYFFRCPSCGELHEIMELVRKPR